MARPRVDRGEAPGSKAEASAARTDRDHGPVLAQAAADHLLRLDHYSRNDRWDNNRYNGYYYNNRWYYGPPPASYYGRQVVKPAPWGHDIAAYLFTGGVAALLLQNLERIGPPKFTDEEHAFAKAIRWPGVGLKR